MEGVPLGVEEELMGTPGIWPKKEVPDPIPRGLPTSTENYQSALDHQEDIKQTYRQERKLGMTKGPFYTVQEAAKFCGVPVPKICRGSLGAIEERDKVRTIHDGTVNWVNPWIQYNIPEKTTAPRPADLLMAAKSLEDMKVKFCILKRT